MVELLGVFVVLAVFVVGLMVVVRAFTLPGEIRRVREEVGALKRELTSLDARLLAAHKKIDQLGRGEAPAVVSHPEPEREVVKTSHVIAPGIEIVREEEDDAEFFAEEIAPTMLRDAKIETAPPPLPVKQTPAKPPVYSAPPAPSESAFTTVLKALGPKDKNMSWEVALGTFWLPRLGALALSTALVFLLTIGFQRLGPGARVAMGYGLAAALLGIAWWLDRKYPKYARVLFGAGFAMTYFVTFATYFVEFAKIFDTPYITLAGLAAIVAVWAGLAQWRKSPVIAGVAMIVGQFTIALATHSIANPGPYSIFGIVFLSIGGAFFLARNGWYAVAGIGLVTSYANHFYLMTQLPPGETVAQFAAGIAVLSVYFFVYAAAEFFSPEAVRRAVPFWLRNAFVAFNSILFLLLGTMTMQGFGFTRETIESLHYPLAAALLGFSVAYLRLRNADPLYNTYFVKGITTATLGLAMQFDAHTLTASLALECALLLFAARRTGLVVTRLVALAAGALAIGQGWWTLLSGESIAHGADGYWQSVVEAGTIVLALFGAALIYQRTDWSSRSPVSTRFSDNTNLKLWYLDFVADPPASAMGARKPVDGLLLPVLFSIAAAVLYAGHTYWLIAYPNWSLALAAGALALTLASAILRATPYGLAALLLFGVSVYDAIRLREFAAGDLYDASNPDAHPIPILILLGAVALASEKRYLHRFSGLKLHQHVVVSFLLYAAFTMLLGLHLKEAASSSTATIVAFLIAAGIFAAAAIPLHRLALAWCSTALIVWAVWEWNFDWRDNSTAGFLTTAWTGIAAAFALDRYFARLSVKYVGDFLVAAAAAFLVPYVFREVPREWIALGWVAGAAALLGYGGLFRVRTAVAIGVATLAAASLRQVIYSDGRDTGTWAIILGFAAAAMLWFAVERTASRLAARVHIPVPPDALTVVQGVSAAAGAALLGFMCTRLPQLAEFYLTVSWSILAVALFGLAIGFREKLYRYCGLAVLALASVRVVAVDTQKLELIQRVLAWGGLGIVLLIIAFGYVKVFTRSENAGSSSPPPKE